MDAHTTILLTVVRHGRTTYNENQITQGQLDVPLDDVGQRQAAAAGKSLKTEHFDCVFASDLSRTIQTATAIINENQSSSRLGIKREPLLRERGYGYMEDKPWSDLVQAAHSAGFVGSREQEYIPDGGETNDQVFERAKSFLERMCSDFQDVSRLSKKAKFNILIVSHGMLITQMIKCLAENYNCRSIPDDKLHYILETSNIPNTGISSFQLDISECGKVVSAVCLIFCSDKHLNALQ